MPRHFLTSSNIYATGSGYLNLSPRVKISELDNATGSYMSIKRTTGFKISTPGDPFNDTRTINYSNSTHVVYPQVLDISTFNKYKGNWVVSPNASASFGPFLSSLATGSVKPFISDQNLDFSIYQEGGFIPFDESRIYLDRTQFYMTGTKANVIEGFKSPLKDKVQIEIPIPTNTQALMSRYIWQGLTNDNGKAAATAPLFYQKRYTGMRYFNFATNEWDDVAKRDPGTDETIETRMWHRVNSADTENPDWTPGISQVKFKPYQFGMSSHLGYMASDIDDLKSMGYAGIGAPTISGAAPYSGSFHAKQNQLLNMSDYIKSPFLLEKAVLRIPVRYIRKHDHRRTAPYKFIGSNRDIDNFVFFMYRQKNTPLRAGDQVDSPAYCSGSQRFLVMSASAAFFNSAVFNDTIRSELSSSMLPHTPAFSYDINMAVSSSAPFADVDTTLILEMTPAVPSAWRGGGSRFPARIDDTTSNDAYPTIVVQDFWPGGTTSPEPAEIGFERRASRGFQVSGTNVDTTVDPGNRVKLSLGWGNTLHGSYGLNETTKKDTRVIGSGFGFYDFRPFTSPTGEGDLVPQFLTPYFPPSTIVGTCNGISMSTTAPSSKESPYLLFPEDTLVLGVDAGISCITLEGTDSDGFSADIEPNNKQGWGGYNNIGDIMSGSYMELRTGKASITLFGSFVKNNAEKLFQLNQNLTSDSIHEAMHGESPVLDQFQIEPVTSYTGSYIDNLVIGVIDRSDGLSARFRSAVPQTITRFATCGNRVSQYYGVGSTTIVRDPYGLASWNVSMKNSVNDGFIRGVTLVSDNERSYDTIMPNLYNFSQRCGMGTATGLRNKSTKGIIATINGNLNEWSTPEPPIANPFNYAANKKAYPYNSGEGTRMRYQDVTLVFRERGLTSIGASDFTAGQIFYANRNHLKTTLDRAMTNEYAVKSLLFKHGISIGFLGGNDAGSSNKGCLVAPPYSTGSSGRNPQPYGAQGYLYGIEDITPLKSKAIFRSDTFGQFRDMLEQRKDRRYFDTNTQETLDAVVQCYFVSSSDGMTLINSSGSDSSNLSQWCTSSIPYHDGKVRNRQYYSLGSSDTTKWKFISDAEIGNIRQNLLVGPGIFTSVVNKIDS